MRSRGQGLTFGVIAGLFGEGLALPLGLVSAAFLTRRLGLGEYGLLGLVTAAVAPVAWAAASLLSGRPGLRLISTSHTPLDTAGRLVWLNAAIGAGGWIVFCLAAPFLAAAFHRPEGTWLLMLGGAEILLFPISRAHRDTLAALGRYRSAGVAAAIQNFVRLATILIGVSLGLAVEGVLLAGVAARLAEIAWCRSVQAPRLRPSTEVRLGAVYGFLTATFVYALCLQIFNRMDILLLSALGGDPATVSRYAAAQMLATAPGLFAMVVSALMIAAITRAEVASGEAAADSVRVRCDQIAAVAAAATVAAAGGSDSLARVLFGERFAEAGPLLGVLLLGGAAAIVASMATAQLVTPRLHQRLFLVSPPMLALGLVGQLVAIPRWGAMGAAATTAVVGAAAAATATLLLPAPRRARLERLAKALACGACGYLVARELGAAGVSMLVDVAIGVATSLVLMRFARVILRSDLAAIVADVQRPAAAV